MEKPTIGVMPEGIWKENRIKTLNQAIGRRLKANTTIPKRWINERNKLIKDLANNSATVWSETLTALDIAELMNSHKRMSEQDFQKQYMQSPE